MTPIDPDFADHFQLLEGAPSWDPDDVAVAARLRQYDEPPPDYSRPHVETNSRDIDGPHGTVPIRVYCAHSSDRSIPPALLWIHGGAFIGGDLDMGESHDVATIICAETGFTVVTVDYRLANNGVHFPVPHDDIMAAWRWLGNGPLAPNVAPDQLFIGGGSAGANLAAGVTLRLRDERSPLPGAALLIYPVMHPVLPPAPPELTEKMRALPALLRFPPDMIRAVNENYIGGPVDTARAYAMPGLGDLIGLPPILLVTSEYDDLNPSGKKFAADLEHAGVDITAREEAGVPHGHLNHPWTLGAQRTMTAMIDYLESRTTSPTAGSKQLHEGVG